MSELPMPDKPMHAAFFFGYYAGEYVCKNYSNSTEFVDGISVLREVAEGSLTLNDTPAEQRPEFERLLGEFKARGEEQACLNLQNVIDNLDRTISESAAREKNLARIILKELMGYDEWADK